MLSILVVCLLAGFQLAAGDDSCQIGTSFTGLDMTKYVGTWYELFRTPNSDEEDFTNCEYDKYTLDENGVIQVTSVAYTNSTRGFITSTGTVPSWTENTFDIAYGDDETWSSTYFMVGTDYQTYSIVAGCLDNDYSRHLYWIASHGTSFDDATKAKVNEVLAPYNLSLDDMEPVDQSYCVQYKSE
uniref:Putative Per a 4 allergen variant n=1 Tax=Periplaneta americana TaxID=6978 RepID=A0A2P0XIE1_PERAM|nr:putative Per a 4 allergen variant [Periplaneta americana]